jgi:hypothetical protein
MTPQAWARGPDFLIVQPCSSACFRVSRMYLFGWSVTCASDLLTTGFFSLAIISCLHGQRSERIAMKYQGIETGGDSH